MHGRGNALAYKTKQQTCPVLSDQALINFMGGMERTA